MKAKKYPWIVFCFCKMLYSLVISHKQKCCFPEYQQSWMCDIDFIQQLKLSGLRFRRNILYFFPTKQNSASQSERITSFWTNHLSQWFNDPFRKSLVSKRIGHFERIIWISDSMIHSERASFLKESAILNESFESVIQWSIQKEPRF